MNKWISFRSVSSEPCRHDVQFVELCRRARSAPNCNGRRQPSFSPSCSFSTTASEEHGCLATADIEVNVTTADQLISEESNSAESKTNEVQLLKRILSEDTTTPPRIHANASTTNGTSQMKIRPVSANEPQRYQSFYDFAAGGVARRHDRGRFDRNGSGKQLGADGDERSRNLHQLLPPPESYLTKRRSSTLHDVKGYSGVCGPEPSKLEKDCIFARFVHVGDRILCRFGRKKGTCPEKCR